MICQYCRTHSPVTLTNIDGWHPRDIIDPLFFNDNTDLHNLIRKRLILPYLTGSFHPSFIEEYTSGLLMDLQKQDGDIRPILCGEIWRRCFGSLTVNTTPVRNEEVKLFTSTYDNFIQTEGIRDGTVSDITLCETRVILWQLRYIRYVLSGRFSRDYVCDLVKGQLFLIVKPYLIYSVISKSCTHVTVTWDTLIGTDRFT